MRKLSPVAADLLAEQHLGLPVWIRSPKQGNEYYTGLSRSKLYELVSHGLIRSFSVRHPGQVKGTRLFHLQSLLDYLARAEKQAVGAAPSEPQVPDISPIRGQTVFVAQAKTGGGTEYLVGIYALEADAWSAAQREVAQGRKVWLEKHTIG